MSVIKMFLLLALCSLPFSAVAADNQQIFLLSKRKVVNSTHTLVVIFYDKAIVTMDQCEREIQRGVRGQWRYYHHTFPRIKGYAEKTDYFCVSSSIEVDAWFERARYDTVYKIDVRNPQLEIQHKKNYAQCLNELRREIADENRTRFCAKASQKINS